MNPSEYSRILHPLVDAVRASGAKDWTDYVVLMLTGVSIALVAWTGWLSHRMRLAAERQADAGLAAMREAHLQRQHAEHMLEEARKQTSLEISPLITLECTLRDGWDYLFLLRNIGRGPAFHVHISSVSEPTAQVRFDTIQLLQANANQQVPTHIEMWSLAADGTHIDQANGSTINDMLPLVNAKRLPKLLPFEIRYKDLYGIIYTTIVHLAFDGEGRFGIHYIETTAHR